MRELSVAEILSLSSILTLEKDVLAVTRVLVDFITEDDLKKQVEAGILDTEERIRGIQQFIEENKLIDQEEAN
ncbi:hypothetical protein [Haloplasma contractile]|uniref:Uncharacterized protein n=1 Tax=Haloplasma contractile SSD-17B TaxID=1033810 RepID=F7PTQ3_9MOLU|nr:hypothetical protein [Haloplasma contractile]ERJ12216.1 hypothetical protein HLPCO_001743 [Haloplasma contractile SSD-17B]